MVTGPKKRYPSIFFSTDTYRPILLQRRRRRSWDGREASWNPLPLESVLEGAVSEIVKGFCRKRKAGFIPSVILILWEPTGGEPGGSYFPMTA
jgi:hypothetical protein